jgi:hypothetical protein
LAGREGEKYGLACYQPISFKQLVIWLSAGGSYLAVTIAAVNRAALSGLKRYGSCLAAIRARGREALTLGKRISPVALIAGAIAGAVAFCFPCLAAIGAALGLIGIASLLEIFLFGYSKRKRIIAI